MFVLAGVVDLFGGVHAGDHTNIAKETARMIGLGGGLIVPRRELVVPSEARAQLIERADGFAQVVRRRRRPGSSQQQQGHHDTGRSVLPVSHWLAAGLLPPVVSDSLGLTGMEAGWLAAGPPDTGKAADRRPRLAG